MSRFQNFRSDNRRLTVANEAARIIQEQGLTDFRFAKEKAVERLGLKKNGALPSNSEIEQALAERNRIFNAESHSEILHRLRITALKAMSALGAYDVLLVGPVLRGNVTEHSKIDLHLFTDSQESVAAALDELNIRHRSVQIRQQFRRRQFEKYPGYRFDIDGLEFSATVFPELQRRYSPLSLVDGKPMQRADRSDLESLLDVTIRT